MKKIPQRMCIVCRTMHPKTELTRIVRLENGDIVVDKTGKAQGRGAYICNNQECIGKCKKQKSLNKNYKNNIDEKYYDMLEEEMKNN